MRLVIAGGLGHIGSSFLHNKSFTDHFDEIFIIDNFSTERYTSLFNLEKGRSFELINCDIRNLSYSEIARIGHADVLIHLAAVTNPTALQGDTEKALAFNFETTKAAVEVASKLNSALIFSSSTSVYSSQVGVLNEDTHISDTNSTYSRVKLQEEELIQESNLRRSVIFRLGTIAGISPGMRFHTAVNKFCFDAIVNRRVTVWDGALDLARPYLSTTDAKSAFVLAATNEGLRGTYNLTTCNLTVREILAKIEGIIGSTFETGIVPSPYQVEKNYFVDSTKIQKAGLKSKNTIDQEIKDTVGILGGLIARE